MSQHDATRDGDAASAATQWLAAFDDAMRRGDAAAAAELFLPDGHWRDVLAFTWHMRTVTGARAIRASFDETIAKTRARSGTRRRPSRMTRSGLRPPRNRQVNSGSSRRTVSAPTRMASCSARKRCA